MKSTETRRIVHKLKNRWNHGTVWVPWNLEILGNLGKSVIFGQNMEPEGSMEPQVPWNQKRARIRWSLKKEIHPIYPFFPKMFQSRIPTSPKGLPFGEKKAKIKNQKLHRTAFPYHLPVPVPTTYSYPFSYRTIH